MDAYDGGAKLKKSDYSSLVKQKLWHMDAYDGGANKQQIEILKMTWNLNTPASPRQKKWKWKLRNGSWKSSWNIRISSIVWNMTDREIINTADLEDRIQMTK